MCIEKWNGENLLERNKNEMKTVLSSFLMNSFDQFLLVYI